MRILEHGRVYLEKGEVIPVWCRCGAIYQPSPLSYSSTCPKCGARNVHTQHVEPEEAN